MMLVKMLLTGTSFATGFEGGPIFPLLFIGGTLRTGPIRNSNIHSTGCGCTCRYGRGACAFLPLPLSIALLLGLFGGQTDLIPVIVIGAVTGFIVSKALTPLLPKPRPQPGSNKQ